MILHYTAIVFISIFSMFTMALAAESNSFMPIKGKRTFQLLFFLLIIANLSEWIGISLNGAPVDFRIIYIGAKFIKFVVAPAIPIVCAEAIDGNRITKIMIIPIIINALLQIFSLFTGVIFSVNSENDYNHGSLYFLYIILLSINMLFAIVHCYKFGQRYQYNNFIFMLMIVILVICVVILQFTVLNLQVDWIGASIGAIMMYVYYDQLVQQVDDMTKMLNRRSYNCRIETFDKNAAILIFDVNNFKYVNDTYGHNFGDQCLIKISEEIRKIFEKYGECYRIGGDEFCVIMTQNIDKAELLISKYLHAMEVVRSEQVHLPSVSVGCVLFEPDKENIDEAIKHADKVMYQFKEKHYTYNMTV